MQIQMDTLDLNGEYDNLKIDIWDIFIKMKRFYRLIIYNETEDLNRILFRIAKARAELDGARILIRNLLVPEDNSYIGNEKISYDWLIDNLGRVTKSLNISEKDNIGILEARKTMPGTREINFNSSSKLSNYVSLMGSAMEHLVYYPLKKGFSSFIKFDKTNLPKERYSDLVLYFIFRELYHSSESMGAISAEQIKSSPKNFGVGTTRPSHGEVQVREPPLVPENYEETLELPSEDENKDEPSVEEDKIFGDDYGENYEQKEFYPEDNYDEDDDDENEEEEDE